MVRLLKSPVLPVRAAVHSGPFHADDVLCAAFLYLAYGRKNVQIVRTRDPEVLAGCAIVLDVGGKDEVSDARVCLDHHQPGSMIRENGVKAAASGVVGLCGKKPSARGGIRKKEPVDGGKTDHAADAEPEERPTHALEREKEREANDWEDDAETDASARGKRKREAARRGEHRAAPPALAGEGQKIEAHRDEKRGEGVSLRDCEEVEVVEV